MTNSGSQSSPTFSSPSGCGSAQTKDDDACMTYIRVGGADSACEHETVRYTGLEQCGLLEIEKTHCMSRSSIHPPLLVQEFSIEPLVTLEAVEANRAPHAGRALYAIPGKIDRLQPN